MALVRPANLDAKIVRPKEQTLLDLIRAEWAEGRQVWVFCEYTDTIPVLRRLAGLAAKAGFGTEMLLSSLDLFIAAS